MLNYLYNRVQIAKKCISLGLKRHTPKYGAAACIICRLLKALQRNAFNYLSVCSLFAITGLNR